MPTGSTFQPGQVLLSKMHHYVPTIKSIHRFSLCSLAHRISIHCRRMAVPRWKTQTHPELTQEHSKTALLSHRGVGAHTDREPGENPSATARAEAIHGTLGAAEHQLQCKPCQILTRCGTSKRGHTWCEHFKLNTSAVSGKVSEVRRSSFCPG